MQPSPAVEGYGRSEMGTDQDVSLAVQDRLFAGLPPYIHAAILPAYISGAVSHALAKETLQLYVAPWLGASGQAVFYSQIAQMDQRYTDETLSHGHLVYS